MVTRTLHSDHKMNLEEYMPLKTKPRNYKPKERVQFSLFFFLKSYTQNKQHQLLFFLGKSWFWGFGLWVRFLDDILSKEDQQKWSLEQPNL